MLKDPQDIPHHCPEHSGLRTQGTMLKWMVGGGATLILGVMSIGVSLLYEIKQTVGSKADSEKLSRIETQVAEQKAHIQYIEWHLNLLNGKRGDVNGQTKYTRAGLPAANRGVANTFRSPEWSEVGNIRRTENPKGATEFIRSGKDQARESSNYVECRKFRP